MSCATTGHYLHLYLSVTNTWSIFLFLFLKMLKTALTSKSQTALNILFLRFIAMHKTNSLNGEILISSSQLVYIFTSVLLIIIIFLCNTARKSWIISLYFLYVWHVTIPRVSDKKNPERCNYTLSLYLMSRKLCWLLNPRQPLVCNRQFT